jgi:hypothetical protein
MHRYWFVNLRRCASQLDGALQTFLVQTVSALNARAWINRQLGRRKHPEPPPALTQAGVFDSQRVGHLDTGLLLLPVMLPLSA